MIGISRVVLLGTLGRFGVEMRTSATGTPYASFSLCVGELGLDGREHTVLVPCECWGKRVDEARTLEPGQVVLLEGKLQRRKKGEQWELYVSGFSVQPVQLPALTGQPE
jgi:single-stranded DNA-binding protein